MPTYKPDIKIFYGTQDSDHRLIPAPDISISTQLAYSNDTIIGYSYNIELTGLVTGLDLRDIEDGDEYTDPDNYGIGSVIDHMHKLRQILSQNGNVLYIVDTNTNTVIFSARGGILRSLNFTESTNNWMHFANYTASLEFHSVNFANSTESCDTSFLDPTTFTKSAGPDTNSGIVDIDKFKIKSFNDSWSFSFSETEAFNKIRTIENSTDFQINNLNFNLQYTINAVGKNFYIYDEENPNNKKLLPAHEQAKNFIQHRLYYQVTNLIDGILKNTYNDLCNSADSLSDLHQPGSGVTGLLSDLGDSRYKIYNEQITCDTSETDGSFSASYSCTVKSMLSSSNWTHPAVNHTFNKSIKKNNVPGSNKTNTNISINGTIQGLIEGGIIRNVGNGCIELPSKGNFLITKTNAVNAYDYAKLALDKIYNANDYNAGVGNTGKKDFKKVFKDALGITLQALGYDAIPDDERPDPPHPTSFNLTHDYIGGTINYTAEYSNNTCSSKYTQVSIQTTRPTKVIVPFNIPNSNSCPIIQELGTYTAQRVNITIQGKDYSDLGKPENIDLPELITCSACNDELYLPLVLPPAGDYTLTQKQYTHNPIDGSFSITLGYICSSGCSIGA
jgi:hypothetical protein